MKLFSFPVYCLAPPTIEHARHSALPEQATFDLDSTVQYHCHTGYATNGFPRAKCLAIDGQASWYGPDISCERKLSNFESSSNYKITYFLQLVHVELQPIPLMGGK